MPFSFDEKISKRGLVITPACDLENDKVEMITYLPMIPLGEFLRSEYFMPTIEKEIRAKWNTCHKEGILAYEVVENIKANLNAPDLSSPIVLNSKLHKKAQGVFDMAKKATEAFVGFRDSDIRSRHNMLEQIFGKKVAKNIVSGIVKNSGRDCFYFLPKEADDKGNSLECSVIAFHGAMSVPKYYLDIASSSGDVDWVMRRDREINNNILCATNDFPIKVATLNHEILVDLINKFCRLYLRLGAPEIGHQDLVTALESIGGSL